MVTAVINLDFVPLLFFFFIYSALEILISRTMEDYRFRLVEIEEEEDEENDFEDEEIEEEDEDEDEDDYEVREREENLIPERIVLPIDFDVFNTGEIEDDDEFDDDDEEDEDEDDYEEEEEEDEELFPVVRMLHRDPIEDDDYEDDEDEDYVEEDDDEELEELFPAVMTSPRVSNTIFHDSELCEGTSEKSGGEIHGLICPICFEAWTSGGEHQICCLPCGHIYGLSCIKKWLQQSRSSGKCPQCNKICNFKDVRVLYASRLCVADEELHKRVRSLEAKCAYLEQKASPPTPDELIDQICSNPAAVQRLATVLAGLYQQPVSP
ncbi:hypothetical protein QVD17_11678 [Tagetes erecta]|uniref:RING-type domain-containing protein n=1 Tax=Tagetes erecta TaxID=13708 RepID=A0AAD8P291_TARER|nr:hypothetical protein QVD17_11678 [Tagetes erecta]